MFRLESLDHGITKKLRDKDEQRTLAHMPSGKLSASMLGEPLQWQVLKGLGIGTRVVDDYVLRKFARGNDVEEWYLNAIDGIGGNVTVLNRQEFVNYKGAIGYVDAMLDLSTTELSYANTADRSISQVIPLEVKSVTNAKFKRISQQLTADEQHKLQGAFYAMAQGTSHYAITYIASDDYRTLTWVFRTDEVNNKIDGIIETYNQQMASGTVPVFKPIYDWQAKPEYNKYPEWANLNELEIKMALEAYYPDAWNDYYAKNH